MKLYKRSQLTGDVMRAKSKKCLITFKEIDNPKEYSAQSLKRGLRQRVAERAAARGRSAAISKDVWQGSALASVAAQMSRRRHAGSNVWPRTRGGRATGDGVPPPADQVCDVRMDGVGG